MTDIDMIQLSDEEKLSLAVYLASRALKKQRILINTLFYIFLLLGNVFF